MLLLVALAAMLAITVIYFSDLGFMRILWFWLAWLAGFALAFIPAVGGILATGWFVVVPIVYAGVAKMNS